MAGILLNRSRQAPADETPAFGGIAERFRRAGDLDRAIALCRDGLKRFPDQLSARVTLGWALLDKGQYEEARGELERVLRRAPDNLAAIRGLAELHDRSEGTLPSMEERESWRQEDQQAENARAAKALAEAQSSDLARAPVPATAVDPFAPISVTLASSTENETFEVLHTAQHAEQSAAEAAGGFDSASDLVSELLVMPVQLEDAATASMAAASDPTPFFVSGADAGYDVPEPFAADEAEDIPVTSTGPVDLVSWHEETPAVGEQTRLEQFGLSTADADLEQFGAFAADVSPESHETVDLAANLSGDLDLVADTPLSFDWPVATLLEEGSDDGADALSVELQGGAEVEEFAAAMWSLEGEMPAAEAEAAVVEAPAEAPIAAFEEAATEQFASLEQYEAGLAAMVAAFEENTGESSLLDLPVFESTPETGDTLRALLEAAELDAAEPEAAVPMADAQVPDEQVPDEPVLVHASLDQAEADIVEPAVEALLEPETVASVMIETESFRLEDTADVVVDSPVDPNRFELVGPELAALESLSLHTDGVELVAFEVVHRDSHSLLLDYDTLPEPEAQPEAAAVSGAAESIDGVYEPAAEAIAEVRFPESTEASPASPPETTAIPAFGMERDQPLVPQFGEFASGGLTMPHAPLGLVGVVQIGAGSARNRAVQAGLERFLRQVQARRLELETESVA